MSDPLVSPDEAASLNGNQADSPAEGVRPRDFSEPLRLSAEQLDDLRLDLGARTGPASAALRPWLRAECAIEVENVAETRFPGLLRTSARGGVTAFSFQVQSGETGWFLWEYEAAVAAIDRALGSASPSEEEEVQEDAETESEEEADKSSNGQAEKRVFSSVEQALLGEILGVLTGELLKPFQIVTSNFQMLQTSEELVFSSDANRSGDLQRLYAGFSFGGPGPESTFRLLVPGLGISPGEGRSKSSASLPEHLDSVPLQLSAVLGTIDLPLQSLLGLEVGDVIPLDTRSGASLQLFLGDEEPELIAKAQFGKSEGRVAVQIEQTHLPDPEPENPVPTAPAPGAKAARRKP